MTRRFRLIVFALLSSLAAGWAGAHATSTSFLTVDARADSRPVTMIWDVSVMELSWVIALDANDDSRITWGEITRQGEQIASLTLRNLQVARGGAECSLASDDLLLTQHAQEPHLSVVMSATCPASGALRLTGSLSFANDSSQKILLDVTTPGGQHVSALSTREPEWVEPSSPSWAASLLTFLVQGVWHVWIGYDHIAFLLLLLLPSVLRSKGGEWHSGVARREVVGDVFRIVTAFTLSHSITLGLAATSVLTLPSGLIEFSIAASIVMAGLMNLLPGFAGWRLPLAFGFGFVHGFGFANALAELGSSGSQLAPMLAGFNLGVEVGQLSLVAVALPILFRARTSPLYAARLMPVLSLGTALLGAMWMATRIP